TAPDHLEYVPARTAEPCLQRLDDLAVAGNGTIQLLQIAVDHEGEVVQPLTGSDLDLTGRFGLCHLTVAEKGPHVRISGVGDTTGMQIAIEPRLVNRVQRADPHGHCRELP